MDIALSLDFLVPGAKYGGSLTGNTKEEYEALEWEDKREKPPWEKVANNLELVKAKKLAEIVQARWEQETGGLSLPDGSIIKTDRESRSLLSDAIKVAQELPDLPIEWKAANRWISVNAEQLWQIGRAVAIHVQAAFSKERALSEQVRVCSTLEELGKITW